MPMARYLGSCGVGGAGLSGGPRFAFCSIAWLMLAGVQCVPVGDAPTLRLLGGLHIGSFVARAPAAELASFSWLLLWMLAL